MDIIQSFNILKDVESLAALAVLLLLFLSAFSVANLLIKAAVWLKKIPAAALTIGSGIVAILFLIWILWDPGNTQRLQAAIAIAFGAIVRFCKLVWFLIQTVRK